jgi:peptide-methionine (R)-S-oxide reductase
MSERSERDWKADLTEEQYRVLREKGTEAPFTGEYNAEKKKGLYRCSGCGAALFHSDTKFDSGTGWLSFWAPAEDDSVEDVPDGSRGMQRTEVVCSGCKGHLGHVFDDGPQPTGLRYCINSVSLRLDEEA